MKKHLPALLSIIAALILAGGALGLLYTIYGRIQTPLRLNGEMSATPGVITEKAVEQRPDRLLPFSPQAYLVRYAFPTPPRGQMRSGEQVVTRRVFQSLGEQGQPVEVIFRPDDPGINAIDPRVVFPGSTGWRLGIALGALMGGVGLLAYGGGWLWRLMRI